MIMSQKYFQKNKLGVLVCMYIHMHVETTGIIDCVVGTCAGRQLK
jgi:hypothetical protein